MAVKPWRYLCYISYRLYLLHMLTNDFFVDFCSTKMPTRSSWMV